MVIQHQGDRRRNEKSETGDKHRSDRAEKSPGRGAWLMASPTGVVNFTFLRTLCGRFLGPCLRLEPWSDSDRLVRPSTAHSSEASGSKIKITTRVSKGTNGRALKKRAACSSGYSLRVAQGRWQQGTRLIWPPLSVSYTVVKERGGCRA
jgi:hypothetical protein